MNKITIKLAAALVTLTVSDGAHAKCNPQAGTNGITGLTTSENQNGISVSQVLTNRFANKGIGDGRTAVIIRTGELVRIQGGALICFVGITEDDASDVDPGPDNQ